MTAKMYQWPRQPQSGLVGDLQRHRLRNQLAEDDVQKSDDDEGDWGRNGVGDDAEMLAGQPDEQTLQQTGKRWFDDKAETEAGQRDTELRPGDGTRQILDGAERRRATPPRRG